MTVITAVNGKGGVGKTTLILCLASLAHDEGLCPLLIDADLQQTASKWWRRAQHRYGPENVPRVVAPTPGQKIAHLAMGSALVFVDSPGRLEAIVLECLRASDRALIPCGQSRADMDEVLPMLSLIARVHQERPALRAQVVLNRFNARTRLGQRARGSFQKLGVPELASALSERMAYMMVMEGLLPQELPQDQVAAQESKALLHELLSPQEIPWLQSSLLEKLSRAEQSAQREVAHGAAQAE